MEDKEKIQDGIDEIIEKILFSPEKRKTLSKEFKENFKKINHTTDIQDNLDTIKIHLVYLLFDLEATRRENMKLREILKERNGGSSFPPGND